MEGMGSGGSFTMNHVDISLLEQWSNETKVFRKKMTLGSLYCRGVLRVTMELSLAAIRDGESVVTCSR